MSKVLLRHRILFILCAVTLPGFASIWPLDAAPAPLSKAELARLEVRDTGIGIAAAEHDSCTPLVGCDSCFGGQAGLAYPRFAGKQDQPRTFLLG